MYKDKKTLHLGGIRTQDLLFLIADSFLNMNSLRFCTGICSSLHQTAYIVEFFINLRVGELKV
jgi:hypothetical protein